eukprot:491696-Amphidinium_carterae.1
MSQSGACTVSGGKDSMHFAVLLFHSAPSILLLGESHDIVTKWSARHIHAIGFRKIYQTVHKQLVQ